MVVVGCVLLLSSKLIRGRSDNTCALVVSFVVVVGWVVYVLLLSSKLFSSEAAVMIPVRSLCVLWLCAVKHDASYYLPVAGIHAHRCELLCDQLCDQ